MAKPDPAHDIAVKHLQRVWETHAKDDPLWAIISTAGKRGGKWDLAEFLATGEYEIAELHHLLEANEIELDRASALDFGCGVGRLSQALARHFATVCGIDISPTMIETANRLNRYPDICRYFLNARDDLRLFEDARFSFIYSNVVLQHIPPAISRRYLAEFARVTRPGGLVVFQLPSRIRSEEGLPEGAWAASIIWRNVTQSCPPGIRGTLHVAVRNESAEVWRHDERRPLMLGNHWLDQHAQIVRQDDGRVMLPNDVRPGSEVELSLDVTTPPMPGVYLLELDLVQEGISWFKDKGSPTLQVMVTVTSPQSPAAPETPHSDAADDTTDAEPPPTEAFEGFSMHCIPPAEVIGLLYEQGLRLEFIIETDRGGPGYQSYFYFARKV